VLFLRFVLDPCKKIARTLLLALHLLGESGEGAVSGHLHQDAKAQTATVAITTGMRRGELLGLHCRFLSLTS
jgi:hypothetical protein